MAIRYLEVTIRLDMGPNLEDADRKEIADDVRAEIHARVDQNNLGMDHEIRDVTTVAEWTAKATGQ